MKLGRLRTYWIIFLSVLTTVKTSMLAVKQQLFGQMRRDWVDQRIHEWCDSLLKLVGVHYQVINPNHTQPEKGQPTIIMCNHSSLYDIPLSFKAFPSHSIRMLAKKELSKIPLMGQAMKASEFPFIDRRNRNQAFKDLNYVRQLLQQGIVMWIAPEGTRSKNGKLGKFKKGGFITAIQTGAVIIPMGIRGAYDILPPRTFQLHLDQKAEIHIGEPIDASQYTLENKEALIQRTRQVMLALTGETNT